MDKVQKQDSSKCIVRTLQNRANISVVGHLNCKTAVATVLSLRLFLRKLFYTFDALVSDVDNVHYHNKCIQTEPVHRLSWPGCCSDMSTRNGFIL
jgi:hypothetical protein